MTTSSVAETDQPSNDIRPKVRTSQAGNAGLWIFVAILALGGFMLFRALEAGRTDSTVPVTSAGDGTGARISALPPLAIPAGYLAEPALQPLLPVTPVVASPQTPAVFPERYITRIIEQPAPQAQRQDNDPSASAAAPLPRPAVIYDAAFQPRPASEDASSDPEAGVRGVERVLAGRLQNPAFTVPKGTVIPAVLESALDSTRPGAARALVSRDVMGFDGTRPLIPRGSRLYGEYQADLGYGQNRALIRWTRLLRPDGVTIELDSPAADPLGRAGIRGKVNSHFFARFGGAILQSVLDIGVGVASRSVADDAVVVALPGSVQNVTRPITEGQSQVRPTLTVTQGVSVSVFVARDLDFSSVDR